LELDVSLQFVGKHFLRVLFFAAVCATIPALCQTQNPPANHAIESAAAASGANANYSTSKPGNTTGATKQTPGLASENGIPVDDSYRVGVEDDLQISVWREPEISSQVTVRPDGFISLPLLNDIQVEGLTTKQLQELVTEKLKGFLTEPQVTVIVRQIRSRKVYLIGQVTHPGSYVLNGDKTVLQLLAEAGGLSQFAKMKSIYVVRKSAGHEVRLPFNYKRAVTGKDPKTDIELYPGDMIVVP
jgi:polysaccharide biosynthesis/export protein